MGSGTIRNYFLDGISVALLEEMYHSRQALRAPSAQVPISTEEMLFS